MGDAPDVPGEWQPSDPAEPPAQLLRRAISHVESLLHRLEHPAGDPPTSDPAPTAGTAVPLTTATAAEADALRLKLHAQEEAHRIHADADGMRAAAAAEGERILEQARELSDRVDLEARERAAQLLAGAQRESAALLAAAQAEADSLRRAARADTDAADAMVEDAAREVERLRGEAVESARMEAAGLVRAEMATAVGGVREGVLALIDQLGNSLAAFDAAVAAVAVVEDPTATDAGTQAAPHLRSVAARTTPGPTAATPARTDTGSGSGDERRPLGLLFGAPRT